MAYKFWQLPHDTVFTVPGEDQFRQFKKISDTRAINRVYPLEWGSAQFPFKKDTEVTPLNTLPISTWEEFYIEIVHEPGGDEDERSEITERFESELFRLVQKYQGQAGLKFYARNSESEIVEW